MNISENKLFPKAFLLKAPKTYLCSNSLKYNLIESRQKRGPITSSAEIQHQVSSKFHSFLRTHIDINSIQPLSYGICYFHDLIAIISPTRIVTFHYK